MGAFKNAKLSSASSNSLTVICDLLRIQVIPV